MADRSSNTNVQHPKFKKGLLANEKATSLQLDITKQILDVLSEQKKLAQSLDAIKKGQATQTQLLLKLSTKMKSQNSKHTFSSAEVVSQSFNTV
jgi:DNA polymerase I-like protein with 3'-5' exonuclease and polymerase domains